MAMGEALSALLCEAEGAEARGRGRARPGGPGRPGNGVERHGDTATRRGEGER